MVGMLKGSLKTGYFCFQAAFFRYNRLFSVYKGVGNAVSLPLWSAIFED